MLDDQGCASEWKGDGAQFTIADEFVGNLWGATCGDEGVAGCSCSLMEVEVVLEGDRYGSGDSIALETARRDSIYRSTRWAWSPGREV